MEKEDHRKNAIAIFSFEKSFSYFSISVFESIYFEVSGFTYYVIMALLDFIVILTLINLTFINNITIILQRICLVSMIANLIAWICWMAYIPHAHLYDKFYVVLYFTSIMLMLIRDKNDDGDHRLDLWAHYFRFDYRKSVDNYQ
ncbi:MAG: hypothetical protein K0U78_15250 [Actinomycetia bacterium]|nr:hypothetical protein [Actinomycetes bacterium]